MLLMTFYLTCVENRRKNTQFRPIHSIFLHNEVRIFVCVELDVPQI